MLRASWRRMLRQTVEREPRRNPIPKADNSGGESDKSAAVRSKILKRASDADEMSARRTFAGKYGRFRPSVLITPDARDGYRQNFRSLNEPPACLEADTFIQGERKH